MKLIPVAQSGTSTLSGSFEYPIGFKGKLPSKQDAIYEEDLVEDLRQDEEGGRYQEEDDRRFQLSEITRRGGHFPEGHNYMPNRRYTDLDQLMDSSSSEDLEHFYQRRTPSRPVAARTFPSGASRGNTQKVVNGRSAYPKEKWVAPPPSLLRVESEVELVSSDSSDDFLKSCEKNGKYQVDKTSILDSKLRSQETEPRYDESRYAIPIIRINSSDDDVAMWRSDDEDSEDSDDWDMSMVRPNRKVSVMPSNDDEDTLESFEMMSFDPKNVQTLTGEHRVNQTKKVASYPNRLVDKPSKKLEKKIQKRNKQRERRNTRNTLAEIERSRSRSRSKGRTTKSSKKQGLSLSKLRTMSAISNRDTWEDYSDHDADTSALGSGKDRLRNEVDSRDGTSYSSSSSLDTQERKAFREQHREEHRRWLKHRKEGKPYPKLSPSQEYGDLLDASSGSVDSEEQRRFRKQKKAEHRRWLAEKKKRATGHPYHGSGDESGDEHPSDEEKVLNKGRSHTLASMPRSNSKASQAGKQIRIVRKAPRTKGVRSIIGGLFQRKKPQVTDRGMDKAMAIFDAYQPSGDEIEVEPPGLRSLDHPNETDGTLPWEKQKKQGLVQQVVSSIRPGAKKPALTVEDLPFPKSDSYDTSLVDNRDKYDDVLINSLPELIPGSDFEVEVGPLVPAISTEYSTESLDAKKKPLRRVKKGLGNTLKSLLHKKPF